MKYCNPCSSVVEHKFRGVAFVVAPGATADIPDEMAPFLERWGSVLVPAPEPKPEPKSKPKPEPKSEPKANAAAPASPAEPASSESKKNEKG